MLAVRGKSACTPSLRWRRKRRVRRIVCRPRSIYRTDGTLLNYLEQVLRPGFHLRHLQLRHGTAREELTAGDGEPAGPRAGAFLAGAICRDTRAGVHLTVQFRDKDERQASSKVWRTTRPL